jgi:hypothetical protein
MAVYDENYLRIREADALDQEVSLALYPILNKAIKNGLTPEDIFYVVSQSTQDWVLTAVLSKRR